MITVYYYIILVDYLLFIIKSLKSYIFRSKGQLLCISFKPTVILLKKELKYLSVFLLILLQIFISVLTVSIFIVKL